MVQLTDAPIRTALKEMLAALYKSDSDTLILEELGLRHGSARVDIAIINGILQGYEIKSDLDDLTRLPHQIQVYSSVLDQVTIVVGYRYLADIAGIVPNWWGIMLAECDLRDNVIISSIRRPESNPCPDVLATTKLLWRDEAISLLEELHATEGFRHKPRTVIYAHLAAIADRNWLHSKVCLNMRSRKDWRSDLRQASDDG